MATYTWPSAVYPAQVNWQLIYNSQGFISPLSGVEQTAELPGARWQASLLIDNLKRSEIAELEAFIFKLRGRANRAQLPDHFRRTPRGDPTGTPLVFGAGQTGSSIITDGWTPSKNGLLLVGDRIGIFGEFKAVTADVNSNASGQATIQFEPPLRNAPLDNNIITTSDALCKMILVDDGQGRLTTRRSLTSTTLTFIEDIA